MMLRPLLFSSSAAQSRHLCSVVLAQPKLVGMITAYQDQTAYALPVARLRTSSTSLVSTLKTKSLLILHTSIFHRAARYLASFAITKRYFLLLSSLQESERLRIQLLEDDVWISPHNPQYNRIFIFEEREEAQYVLRPSLALAKFGPSENKIVGYWIKALPLLSFIAVPKGC